jgi:hypothetical protein
MESLAPGTVIPVSSFNYQPLEQFSFFANNGNEYEITQGINKGNEVIKVRYGSSRSPQVLFNSGNRYFLNVYNRLYNQDPENEQQFNQVDGTIGERTPDFQPFVPKKRTIDQPMREVLAPRRKAAVAKPERSRSERAREREIRFLPNEDELSRLFSRAVVARPPPPDRMQQGFGKGRVKISVVNADIKYLQKL